MIGFSDETSALWRRLSSLHISPWTHQLLGGGSQYGLFPAVYAALSGFLIVLMGWGVWRNNTWVCKKMKGNFYRGDRGWAETWREDKTIQVRPVRTQGARRSSRGRTGLSSQILLLIMGVGKVIPWRATVRLEILSANCLALYFTDDNHYCFV